MGYLQGVQVGKEQGHPLEGLLDVISSKIKERESRFAKTAEEDRQLANELIKFTAQEKVKAKYQQEGKLGEAILEGKITPDEQGTDFSGTPLEAITGGKKYKTRTTFSLTGNEQVPEGFEITGYDQKGQPMIRKIKLSGAQEKRKVEVEELKSQIGSLTELFGQARQEMNSVAGAGQSGIGGRLAGMFGAAKGKAGYSPSVNVYNDKRKAFATTVAKAAGEVRPTDQDIERFLGTLPDLKKNDEENAIIINQLEKDLESKDAGIVWKERIGKTKKDTTSKKTITLPSGKTITIGQ